jgi:hypothetical protein
MFIHSEKECIYLLAQIDQRYNEDRTVLEKLRLEMTEMKARGEEEKKTLQSELSVMLERLAQSERRFMDLSIALAEQTMSITKQKKELRRKIDEQQCRFDKAENTLEKIKK